VRPWLEEVGAATIDAASIDIIAKVVIVRNMMLCCNRNRILVTSVGTAIVGLPEELHTRPWLYTSLRYT
jgi:hypothetical protein